MSPPRAARAIAASFSRIAYFARETRVRPSSTRVRFGARAISVVSSCTTTIDSGIPLFFQIRFVFLKRSIKRRERWKR